MTVIGLSGYARSGKDTFAAALVEHLGFERVSFAEPLYAVLHAINPLIPLKDGTQATARLRHLVALYGWEKCKDVYPEVRQLLQRTGTEAGRAVLGNHVWVYAALSKLDPDKDYVFTDVRFLNEADAIRLKLKGTVIRIERPGFEPVNPHVSETALDDYRFDIRFANAGTEENLRNSAVAMAEGLRVAW